MKSNLFFLTSQAVLRRNHWQYSLVSSGVLNFCIAAANEGQAKAKTEEICKALPYDISSIETVPHNSKWERDDQAKACEDIAAHVGLSVWFDARETCLRPDIFLSALAPRRITMNCYPTEEHPSFEKIGESILTLVVIDSAERSAAERATAIAQVLPFRIVGPVTVNTDIECKDSRAGLLPGIAQKHGLAIDFEFLAPGEPANAQLRPCAGPSPGF
jgi:hypothetical protein